MAKQRCGKPSDAEVYRDGYFILADLRKKLTPADEPVACIPPWDLSDEAFTLVIATEFTEPHEKAVMKELLTHYLENMTKKLKARIDSL